MSWWRRDRRARRDWLDMAEAWDEEPGSTSAGRPSDRRAGPDPDGDWPDDSAYDDDETDTDLEWDDEEDPDAEDRAEDDPEYDHPEYDDPDYDDPDDHASRRAPDRRDHGRGWHDPEPSRRRESWLSRIVLFPVRLVLLPFKIALWFVALSLLWVGAYAWVDPPSWTYLETERAREGQAVHFWQDLDRISPHLVRAVIAAEDARFCSHSGIDFRATRAALEETLSGERVLGGSTITQQAAKNVFLWHGRSWLRKGLEAGFAMAMEAFWGKRRIVEVYLNVAEFDRGVFGAEAASRGYFGVRAADLTLDQAARLAAVLPDPKERSAASPGDYTARRATAIADGARTLERTGAANCAFMKAG